MLPNWAPAFAGVVASRVAGGDAPRIRAMVLPEAATWLATIEVGTLVDVAVAA